MFKNLSEISEKDKAYFAGFFDGEGCVRVDKAIHKLNNRYSYSLAVSFGNTYVPTLYEMKKLFGGSICLEDMELLKNRPSVKGGFNANPDNYKQRYNLAFHGKRKM